METDNIHPDDEHFRKYIPHITILCGLASVVLFAGINITGNVDNWENYKYWGAPSAIEIFSGSYWGLLSSGFLHTELWHIGFNLYWLWILGKKIEFESGKFFYAILIVTSALVSSTAQLSFSESTGIGLSGIGYALFGFIVVKGRTDEAYKNYLDEKTIHLLLIWLLLCIVFTQAQILIVGNAAHIAGMLWGALIAYLSQFRKPFQLGIGIIVLACMCSMIFWSPFSTAYLSYQAYELHRNEHVDAAMAVYKKILERDAENEFAKVNLKQLEILKLSDEAYRLHANNKFSEARQVYNEIICLDPANEWAKENLQLLPNE